MPNICVVGSGVIGTATGKTLISQGHTVEFRDIDSTRVETLKKEGLVARLISEPVSESFNFFFICVPTPNDDTGSTELSPLKDALQFASMAIAKQTMYAVVAIRSTVPVGTANEFAVPLMEQATGKKVGNDFDVCANPEYLREAHALDDAMHPRVVVIGAEYEISANLLTELYKPFASKVVTCRREEAEMHKYLHNLLNATKISFFNEQRQICENRSLNADLLFELAVESAEAQWNPAYGTKNLGPYSGTCLPKDTRSFLSWASKKLGTDLPLLTGVIKVNDRLLSTSHPET